MFRWSHHWNAPSLTFAAASIASASRVLTSSTVSGGSNSFSLLHRVFAEDAGGLAAGVNVDPAVLRLRDRSRQSQTF